MFIERQRKEGTKRERERERSCSLYRRVVPTVAVPASLMPSLSHPGTTASSIGQYRANPTARTISSQKKQDCGPMW